MLLHQGIGLDAFNAMPDAPGRARASTSAATACRWPPIWHARAPFDSHDELFRCADALLFGLSEESVDSILQAYPDVGRRPGSEKSQAEQCAITDERPEVMAELASGVEDIPAAVRLRIRDVHQRLRRRRRAGRDDDRLHNDHETERKVVRNELARINRTRLERMLGPEGGYDNW